MNAELPLATHCRHALVIWLRPRGKLTGLPEVAASRRQGTGRGLRQQLATRRENPAFGSGLSGLDVGYCNQQDSIRYADVHLLVPPAEFADAIAAHGGQTDEVVSSHNRLRAGVCRQASGG